MPTSTYTPLANITLGSSAASVTFSSISQSYRDLILVIKATTSTGDNSLIRFNSDSGANYNLISMYGNGSTTTSSTAANQTSGYLAWNGATDTTVPGVDIIQIMDYSATDKQKTFLVREDQPAYGTQALAQLWASTAAITSILVKPSSATWSTGSTFALYGIAA